MSRRTPRTAQPVYDAPCVYRPDPDAGPDADGERPCVCHMPKRHARHQIADHTAEQAEHCRRAGEDL